MTEVTIKCTKDLYNDGQCFTKGEYYTVKTWDKLTVPSNLMEKRTINDQGQEHVIGSWWRHFIIVK